MPDLCPGFDEYMNLVLDDASEVHLKRKTEKVGGDQSLLRFIKVVFFFDGVLTCC